MVILSLSGGRHPRSPDFPCWFFSARFLGEISSCFGLFALSSVPVGHKPVVPSLFQSGLSPTHPTPEAIAAVFSLQSNHEGAVHFDLSTCALTIFGRFFPTF
ncbi:hypothetical protein [Laspinema olomoucense]|uniref:hypothetical protein n=1 Tax=Laspinema olomoucense TaxID=3231600 RepID=UPI0021BAB2F6|nr:hypothetical protein [Laspinema sp. D3c]MCT7996031.1 hypothetical protein [Laspinema sp. D3c]